MGKRYSCLVAMLGLSLLAGCAWLPQPEEDVHDTLATRAQLDERFTRLEAAVEGQCGGQQARFTQQQQRLDRVDADLREVGSLLRGLRSDVARAGDEPERVARECAIDADIGNKTLLGRSEWIGLPDVGTYLKARIDTGAETSSLSATEITPFERDGEDWIRFKLGLNDDDAVVDSVRDRWIEAPVERRVRIIQASGEESRPVISLMMTLGTLRDRVQFTLSDRTHLDHPVLLGRRFLLDIAIVDVAEQYLHERPEFPGGKPATDAGADEAIDAAGEADG
ncbi:ATP-dependent zinc protease [Halomonas aestuarii]|uniref:ATP-dependent zinc protease n=1 Tax=Halomonas aestuarii TaxID=1897729 RepID=A0A1J0VJN9_9GAMM|nr:ATP-dependent zinc protease [Halomonas aestuarii]APE32231.1 ATP-dependent zinc protease [Halomonas aestuarii]